MKRATGGWPIGFTKEIAAQGGSHGMERLNLFNNVKYCSICRKPMPLDYEKELCPLCEENELFGRVKEFIRSRHVTEYQVAEEFNLPLRKVKAWIREGRIEYKEVPKEKLPGLKCVECGAPIQFGNYCNACYRKINIDKGTYIGNDPKEDSRMRFLD